MQIPLKDAGSKKKYQGELNKKVEREADATLNSWHTSNPVPYTQHIACQQHPP